MLMEGSCASMAPTSLSLVWHPSPATYAWTLPLCSLVSLCYRTRCLLLCCLSGRLLSLFLMCASFLCKAGLGSIQFGTALFVLLPAFFLWSLAGSSLGSIAETSSILLEQWGAANSSLPFCWSWGEKYPNPSVSFNRDYSVYQVQSLRSHQRIIAFHLYGKIHAKDTWRYSFRFKLKSPFAHIGCKVTKCGH